MYGFEIWISDFNININNCDQLPFEKIQHSIFKDILGVQKKASNLAIKYELGTLPICCKALISMFKYYQRLKNQNDKNGIRNQVLIVAFLEDVNLYNDGVEENWQGQIDKLKKKLELSSLKITNNTFSNCLKNYYIKNVNLQLQNIEFSKSGKLLFYSQIRKNYELQDYLKFPINKAVRSKLTKLRISAHPLEIETGRYSKPCIPKESRFCYFCKTAVENEIHLLYDCPIYKELRKKYNTLKTYNLNDNMLKENHSKMFCNPENAVDSRRLCKLVAYTFIKKSVYPICFSL